MLSALEIGLLLINCTLLRRPLSLSLHSHPVFKCTMHNSNIEPLVQGRGGPRSARRGGRWPAGCVPHVFLLLCRVETYWAEWRGDGETSANQRSRKPWCAAPRRPPLCSSSHSSHTPISRL